MPLIDAPFLSFMRPLGGQVVRRFCQARAHIWVRFLIINTFYLIGADMSR
jgi:hypothetical protein